MAESLKKIDQQHVARIADEGGYEAEMVEALWNTLNAAIDRINDLESRYEGHSHIMDSRTRDATYAPVYKTSEGYSVEPPPKGDNQ